MTFFATIFQFYEVMNLDSLFYIPKQNLLQHDLFFQNNWIYNVAFDLKIKKVIDTYLRRSTSDTKRSIVKKIKTIFIFWADNFFRKKYCFTIFKLQFSFFMRNKYETNKMIKFVLWSRIWIKSKIISEVELGCNYFLLRAKSRV